MTDDRDREAAVTAAELVAALRESGRSIAVAESLTGGLLVSELVSVPGASAVVVGGVVAYATELKHTLLDVSGDLLAEHGPVHPEVARAMATGVRTALAVEGRPVSIGVSTTGVAGPGPEGGHPAGTAFVGIATDSGVHVRALRLGGDRAAIRHGVVSEAIAEVFRIVSDR